MKEKCQHQIEMVTEKFINTKGVIKEFTHWECVKCDKQFDNTIIEEFVFDKHSMNGGGACWCNPKVQSGVVIHNDIRVLH